MSEFIPWIEKYRPKDFDNIVLDDTNKRFFNGILKLNKFPNILLYGPPGTGKTTTIINIINKFQQINNQYNKQLKIHLNASDERGIDIIRMQISQFVQSKALFVEGTKFVVLDEVDYMTKNAQIALKQLLHNYSGKITFCLICNYISKIEQSLQNEFLRIRFNHLPNDKVFDFLKTICISENLNISNDIIQDIQNKFKSDMRSMINYLKTNERLIESNQIITINNKKWVDIYTNIKNKGDTKKYINELSKHYNMSKREIILNIIKIHINNCKNENIESFIEFSKKLIYNYDNEIGIDYFSEKISDFL